MSKAVVHWEITPHVCMACFGRVLQRALPASGGGERMFRCADCGVEGSGATPAVICTCGFRVKGRATMGLKCAQNTQKTPEFPAEIIARQA